MFLTKDFHLLLAHSARKPNTKWDDQELGIHFLPVFDIDKQLWKVEVEIDAKTAHGKQLHNPFINLSLVHFQPFSINHKMVLVPGTSPVLFSFVIATLAWCLYATGTFGGI